MRNEPSRHENSMIGVMDSSHHALNGIVLLICPSAALMSPHPFREMKSLPSALRNRMAAILLFMGIMHILSACAPQFSTPVESQLVSPAILANAFISYDGTKLPLRKWLPPGNIEGVVIAVHGFNDYSNFITDSAPFFNQHGLALYSYDQRGFGDTNARGRWGGTEAMARDLATLTELVKKSYPRAPIYLLGESMGGAVVIVMMARKDHPKIDGAILCAPAVWSRNEMPFYQRWALALSARLFPWWKVTGESLSIIASDNLEMLRALGKDPMVIKKTRIDTIYGLANLMDEAYKDAKYFTVHSLILYGKKDEIIPEKSVLDFYRQLPLQARNRQEITTYESGYHMLLRDLQARSVREDIMAWIENSSRSLASGKSRQTAAKR